MSNDFEYLPKVTLRISCTDRVYHVGRVATVRRVAKNLCITTVGSIRVHYIPLLDYTHLSDRDPRVGDYIVVSEDRRNIRFDEHDGVLFNLIKPLLGDNGIPSIWRFKFWRIAIAPGHPLSTPESEVIYDDGVRYRSIAKSNIFIRD